MANWDNQEKLSNQTAIAYNEAGVTYGDLDTQYNGRIRTSWDNQTEH